MNVLLDTHALIWFLEDNPALSLSAKKIIENPQNEVFVSIISFYEISIKLSIGKLSLPNTLEDFISKTMKNEIQILDLFPSHVITYQQVPLKEEHKDPFDRIIIASSIVENLSIITVDEKFNLYKPLVSIIW